MTYQELLELKNKRAEKVREGEGLLAKKDFDAHKTLMGEIQKMNEGYYTFIQFDAEGSAIAEIEQRMRIMDNVIRYLCVKQNEA